MKSFLLVSACIVLQTLLAVGHLSATGLPIMRISVENTAAHVQTLAVSRFALALQEKLQGMIDVRFYPNAQLFRDKDVVQALGQGKIEMAVPGTWHLAAHEPNVGVLPGPTSSSSARRRRWSPASPTPVARPGIACFGPSAAAARIEGSKAFAKDVMAAAGVPTAAAPVFETPAELARALAPRTPPYVVKDDGLAAGKGVVVTDDRADRA